MLDSRTVLFSVDELKSNNGAHMQVAEGLVKRDVDVNHVDKKGQSALFVAASGGLLEYIVFLLENRALLDVVTRSGEHPIHGAASKGKVCWAPLYADLSSLMLMLVVFIFLLLFFVKVEAMKVLVDKGENIAQGDFEGSTPLHSAAAAGEQEAARYCVEHGADINQVDGEGRTALYLASENG